MGARPSQAVKDVIEAAMGSETVVKGLPTDKPDRLIACISTGGYATVFEAGGDDVLQPTVHVLIRTKKGQGAAAETLVWAVHNALNRAEPTDYCRCVCRAPPSELKPDGKDRPVWSINVELTIIE